MKLLLCCVLLICTVFIQLDAKRILGIFPHFGYSHFKVFYPLLHNLSERGHNVTVITYIKTPTLPNRNYNELLLEGMKVINVVPLDKMKATRTWKDLLDEYISLHSEGQKSCRRLYESGHVEEVLKRHQEQPYELVITEYFNTDCHMAMPFLMQTPVVALSSCVLMPWHYDRIIMPDIPSFVQSEFVGFQSPLNWHERLMNFIQAKGLSLLYRYYTNYQDNKLIKHYLNIDVDVTEVAKQSTRLILGNQHYSLMGIRPYTQQFVEIGGIHINEEELNKDLPQEIDMFLRNTQKDILFISWGSMIKSASIEQEKLHAILNVLKKFNLKVIWKWEADEIPIKSDQFLFIKWAPQLALIYFKKGSKVIFLLDDNRIQFVEKIGTSGLMIEGNPKITLFWGHGGLLSTTEAVYCGKRMLLTPIYGDQFVNSFAVENRRIGRIINYNKIDEETLEREINHMLHSNYSTKALEISKIFRDRESKPLATATWWVEHVLQHNITTEILHSYAVDLNWFVYYSIDAIAIILATLILFVVLAKTLLRLICCARVQKIQDKFKQN